MRRGMTLIEIMVASVILTGALLGMGVFVSKFGHSSSGDKIATFARAMVEQRQEAIAASGVAYASLDATFDETGTTNAAGYKRTTAILRDSTALVDYKTITVTVTPPASQPAVTKTTIIAKY